MCSTEWLDATYYVESVSFFVSVTLNAILFKLILEKKRNEFGNYKYLMMSFAVCNIFYSMCNFLSKPSVHITNTSFIVFTTLKWSHFSKDFGSIAVRIWGLSSYFLCGPTENKDRELAIEFQRAYCLKPDSYAYVGPQYFYESLENGKTQFHLPSFLGIGVLAVQMFTTFSLVILFGYRTYSTLNEDGITCFAKKALQKQLFKTLIIQTCIPFVFMYLPVSCMFVFPMFGVKIEAMANIIPISVAIYPCLEPLVAMIFINDFRRRIGSLMFFCKGRHTQIGTLSGSQTSNSGYSMNSFSTRT
ncbi:hypothetical protein CAEBREN_29823 [Caenorhabditis brenneri]|uniref:Seven TM Receptor n=1 Tax=Caenorhabditis brenneri TaxID=135651 RepID=G0P464_CAEBE|nr:hypothetical protein CAEBREN_29823 [Caenorhabditis brenneri]